MTEAKIIDFLKKQSYQKRGREQVRMKGETVAIRLFDPEDREDMQRLRTINDDKEVKRWMVGEESTSDEGIINWANDFNFESPEILFAVSGTNLKAGESETGEVQGFVYCYAENDLRLKKLVEEGALSEDEIRNPVEISGARFPNSASGQMASGVRQVCWVLNQVRGETGSKDLPDMLVTAYTDPKNTDSVRVLEHCGFKKRGQIFYDEKSEKKGVKDDFYVLDWKELYKISLEKNGMEIRMFGE